MNQLDPTKRFSNRVKNYVKYRPSYPTAVYTCLQEECGLRDTAVIADIGSGTGLFSELFLKQGNIVNGVEPNQGMREAGDTYLKDYVNFKSIIGTAENTTLANNSVDFVVAGQAAHWFDLPVARKEFERILKPGGGIALCWNRLDVEGSPFMAAYEVMYQKFSMPPLTPQNKRLNLVEILLGKAYKRRKFPNPKKVDYESLKGGILSSSVMPLDDEALIPAIQALFDQFAEDGQVEILNITHLLFAPIS